MQYTNFFADRVEALADTTIRDTLALAAQPGVISLGGGIPNPSLFPLDRVRTVIAKLTDAELQQSLQYSGTQGSISLRRLIARQLSNAWGRSIAENNILITTGSQQGLDLVGKTFIETGDCVAIENPSYLAAIAAFQTNAPAFAPFELAADGPNLAQLEQVLQKLHPKLIYAIPSFQNPTGAVWSSTHRTQVLQLAEHHNCLLVEDDPYGELYFGNQQPPLPLAAGDITGRVLYLGTFSKTLVPGLRIGFIVADAHLIDTLTLIKQSMDLHSSTFSQVVLEKLLADSKWYQQHLATIRAYYQKQRDSMVEHLHQHLPNSVNWNSPNGGLFVWLKITGIDSRELLKQSVALGVAFMPGYPFYAGQPDYETIRLTFATADQNKMHQAISILCNAVG